MSNFYTEVISKDHRFNSTETINDVMLLEPVTRGLVAKIIADAHVAGIQLMVFETYRSQNRQKKLFDEGASKLEHVGVHHYGLACDIVYNVHGKPNWDGDFKKLGKLAHANSLIWGGDWGTPAAHHTFIDNDHVQRITIARQPSLFAGTWYPDENYNPYVNF